MSTQTHTPIQINAMINLALSRVDPEAVEDLSGLQDFPDHPLIRECISLVSENLYDNVLSEDFSPSDIYPTTPRSEDLLSLLIEDYPNTSKETELNLFSLNYSSMDYPIPSVLGSTQIRDIPMIVSTMVLFEFLKATASELVLEFRSVYHAQLPHTSSLIPLTWDNNRLEYVENNSLWA